MVLLIVAVVMLLPAFAAAQVYVNPYVRRNGTQVEGHYRSAPDGNPYNNYSYPGNTNPYTGRVAPGSADSYLTNHQGDRLRLDRPYPGR
jgi:hypothetical protein